VLLGYIVGIAGREMSVYLRKDQVKAGALLRSKKDGSLMLVLTDAALYQGYVTAYDFKLGSRVQLNAHLIHAELVRK